MSRPRKPYGPNPPGRLHATMIKVLAAEMSDPGRLGRGKRYWADDAVIDLVIGHGVLTAEVQGSRAQPYVVTIRASEGDGVPSRRQVRVYCTCPDDEGPDSACKHAVATLFALSDEVAIDPDVVDRWRGLLDHHEPADDTSPPDDGDDEDDDRSGWASVTRLTPRPPRPWETARDDDDDDEDDDHDDDDDDWSDDGGDDDDHDDALSDLFPSGSRPNRVVPLRRPPNERPRPARPRQPPINTDPSVAQIESMLHTPNGFEAPTFPPPAPLSHPRLGDRMVNDVLTSALDEFDIEWS